MGQSNNGDRKLCLVCNRQYSEPDISVCTVDATQLVSLGPDEFSGWLDYVVDKKYKLTEFIGKGTTRRIYLASRLSDDVNLAVSLPSSKPERSALENFHRRASLLKGLKQPGLVELCDFGTFDADVPYYVEEFIAADTLKKFMSEPTPTMQAHCMNAIVSAGHALFSVHEHGLLHGALSPHKILLNVNTPGPKVRLSVPLFNVNSATNRFPSNTQGLEELLFRGSAFYISPEELTGKPVTPAADQYCLALITYEILAGKPTFKGANVLQTATLHVTAEPDMSEIPGRFRKAISKALSKTASSRFANIKDFVQELAAAG